MKTVIFGLVLSLAAFGCQCDTYDRSTPFCEAHNEWKTVFLGTVIDHNHDDSKRSQWTNYLIRVDEVFKGMSPELKEVFIDPGSYTSCYRKYEPGKQYVFFAEAPNAERLPQWGLGGKEFPQRWDTKRGLPVYTVMGCNPTRLAESVPANVRWLRQKKQGIPMPTRVEGTVVFVEDRTRAAGATVQIEHESKRIIEQITDSDGKFVFLDVPAGGYLVRVRKEGYTPTEDFEIIDVEAGGGCAIRNFELKKKGR